jgi:phage gpG-like protein
VRVTASGVDGVIAELDALAERAADLGPVLEVAASDTRTLIDDSFRKSRAPDGPAWEGLDRRTLARRRQGPNKRARKATILVDTGRLKNSIQSTHTKSVLKFGTNVVYAAYHQFGSGRMYRPFLPIEKTGSQYMLMTGGPAGRHWREVRDMVIEYIRTGRITG